MEQQEALNSLRQKRREEEGTRHRRRSHNDMAMASSSDQEADLIYSEGGAKAKTCNTLPSVRNRFGNLSALSWICLN